MYVHTSQLFLENNGIIDVTGSGVESQFVAVSAALPDFHRGVDGSVYPIIIVAAPRKGKTRQELEYDRRFCANPTPYFRDRRYSRHLHVQLLR